MNHDRGADRRARLIDSVRPIHGKAHDLRATTATVDALTRLWARKGSRPRAPKDCRYTVASIFGAVCPARATGAVTVMPYAITGAMNVHPAEIS